MGRVKANKPRRERPASWVVQNTTPEQGPPQILFDSSDPRIEVFRKVKTILQAGGEPDPADVQLLWEWHNE